MSSLAYVSLFDLVVDLKSFFLSCRRRSPVPATIDLSDSAGSVKKSQCRNKHQ
jgi:hypothetical protein